MYPGNDIEDFGFAVRDLSAAVAGEELRPLRYDHTKYVEFESFLLGLHDLPKRKVRVRKSELGKNGKVVSDKMENYLSARGESSSALKQALVSPYHYLVYSNSPVERKADHFTLGTFCHEAFLEPRRFEGVRVEPKENIASNAGCANLIRWYWEQLGMTEQCLLGDKNRNELREMLDDCRNRFESEGLVCVDSDHIKIINLIRRTYNIYGGGILPSLLRLAETETSFYGTDPSTGLAVKVRPDAYLLEENIGHNIVVSFKTTEADTIEQFARDAARYKYDLSEGMYLDVMSHVTGRQFTGTLMVVLQTVQPWQVFALWWSPEDLEAGKYKYHQALDIVAESREKNSFPGFDARAEEGARGIIQFELPAYSRLALPEQFIEAETKTR